MSSAAVGVYGMVTVTGAAGIVSRGLYAVRRQGEPNQRMIAESRLFRVGQAGGVALPDVFVCGLAPFE